MYLKRTLAIAAIAAMGLAWTSCNNKQQSADSQTPAATPAATVMEVDDVLANADSLAGKEVTFHGVCTHTCKHGARKIFLMGSDDTQVIRVEAGELGAFSQDCVNNIVTVTGKLVEQRVDEAYLQNWEAQAKAQTAEQHGEGTSGCDTEKNARGETGNTVEERIADFRTRIAEEQKKSGKDYLSFYFVEASSYEIER